VALSASQRDIVVGATRSLAFAKRGDGFMRGLSAYIDPGSGSLLIQGLMGGIAAAAVLVKVYWGRLLRALHLRKPEDDVAVD